ncbi:hypothetical protein ILYODFUR_010903 [Ilyodon furcidens]|uniref:Uncharacterized protein n=1 Tax=Ilyodon furcidens TaxID=33524 RepID=A0ABV0SW56_9TELE
MVLFLRQPIDSKLSLLARQHTTNGSATAATAPPCVWRPPSTHTLNTRTFPFHFSHAIVTFDSVKPDQSVTSIRKHNSLLEQNFCCGSVQLAGCQRLRVLIKIDTTKVAVKSL